MDKQTKIEHNYVVYRHIAPNGKMYVGVTKQNPPRLRWLNGKGYNENQHFANAINKYGWENFKHEILLEGLTAKQASLAEQIFISYWHLTDPNYGYNINGGGLTRFHVSESTREKLSLSKRGIKNPNYGKDLSGVHAPNYGKHHSEATKRKFSEQRRGKNNSFYGKRHTEKSKALMREHLPKRAVAQIDMNTNEVINIFVSQKEAERQTGTYHSHIAKCCKGKAGYANGYKWKYAEDI